MVSRFDKEMNRSMTEDQFCQVVDAILNGKYSWACVLILQFAGYNPLHYIPYRTYNRLMKENDCHRRRGKQKPSETDQTLAVDNLPHIKDAEKDLRQVRGGGGFHKLLRYPLFYNPHLN